MDVLDMDREQFIAALEEVTTPKDIYHWSPQIYAYMSGLFRRDCMDSVLREWAFQWASEKLDIDYDKIYKRWLEAI